MPPGSLDERPAREAERAAFCPMTTSIRGVSGVLDVERQSVAR
jgi:hypothetical protein